MMLKLCQKLYCLSFIIITLTQKQHIRSHNKINVLYVPPFLSFYLPSFPMDLICSCLK